MVLCLCSCAEEKLINEENPDKPYTANAIFIIDWNDVCTLPANITLRAVRIVKQWQVFTSIPANTTQQNMTVREGDYRVYAYSDFNDEALEPVEIPTSVGDITLRCKSDNEGYLQSLSHHIYVDSIEHAIFVKDETKTLTLQPKAITSEIIFDITINKDIYFPFVVDSVVCHIDGITQGFQLGLGERQNITTGRMKVKFEKFPDIEGLKDLYVNDYLHMAENIFMLGAMPSNTEISVTTYVHTNRAYNNKTVWKDITQTINTNDLPRVHTTATAAFTFNISGKSILEEHN